MKKNRHMSKNLDIGTFHVHVVLHLLNNIVNGIKLKGYFTIQ